MSRELLIRCSLWHKLSMWCLMCKCCNLIHKHRTLNQKLDKIQLSMLHRLQWNWLQHNRRMFLINKHLRVSSSKLWRMLSLRWLSMLQHLLCMLCKQHWQGNIQHCMQCMLLLRNKLCNQLSMRYKLERQRY